MTRTNATTFDRRIADWLAGDPNEAPETVLSSVLEAVPTVRQRRVVGGRWSSRRRDRQRLAAAFGGIATIGLVVFAVAMIERGNESVGPSAPTTASPAATSAPSPAATAESTATRAFHSTFNRYTARYPADWSLEGATAVWAPTLDDVVQPAAMDVYAPVPNARGFVAASTQLDGGLSIDDWIEQTLPTRQRPSLRACDDPSAAGVSMGLPPETWQPIRLFGHEARERDSCYAIDVVVLVGRRVYLFTGASPRPAMTLPEERAAFDAFLASITFDDDVATTPTPSAAPSVTPAPTPVELTGSWSSPRYGYDAKIPPSWTVAPATATAELDRSLPFPRGFAAASMDIVFEGLVKRLWVVSMPIAETANLDAWAAVHFPQRQRGDVVRSCGGTSGLPPEVWVPITVGDLVGRERDSCGYIDVVVVSGSRAYVVTARSSSMFRTPRDQRVLLDAFVASMRFRPDDARAEPSAAPYAPRTTFTSALYGYSLDVPWTLDVLPGETAWTPGESWSKRGVADRFDRRGGFSIVSTTLPDGVTLDDWIAANVPAPTQASACRFGFAIVGVPTGTWQDADIGGHPGRIRDGCEVDGVVAIGRRVYVIAARSLEPGRRITNLEEIARYIDFRPKDATAP